MRSISSGIRTGFLEKRADSFGTVPVSGIILFLAYPNNLSLSIQTYYILKIITSMIKLKMLILVYLEQYPIVDRENK